MQPLTPFGAPARGAVVILTAGGRRQRRAVPAGSGYLCQGEPVQSAASQRITSHYRDRLQALGDGPNTPLNPQTPPEDATHPLILAEHKLWREALEAERRTVIALRQSFQISDDVMNDMLRDIDLMHNRFANDA